MGYVPAQPGWLYRLLNTLWADNVNDVYSAADATQLGADFEIVIGHYQQYGNTNAAKSTAVDNVHSGAIAAGHECKALVYINGTYGEKADFPTSGNHGPSEFMYSGDPALPYLIDSGFTYMMDPRDRGWNYACRGTITSVPEQMTDRRSTRFGTTKADGGLVDSLGWGICSSGYNVSTTGDGNPPTTPTSFAAGTNVTPLNSQTGNTWISASEKATWVRYTGALVGACSSQRSGGAIISAYCNGVSRGTRWWDIDGPTWYLAKYAQLCMAENWIRDSTEAVNFSALQTVADWKADVNYVIDCQNLGRGAMVWTKVWGNHTHTDDVTFNSPISGNTIYFSAAHGFSNGDKVSLAGSGTVPTGTSTGGMYFVVNKDASSSPTAFNIQLANSSSGSPIAISGGANVRVRPVISQNSTDDNNDTNVVKWHRLFAGSFMLATNGNSFAHFIHDWPNGNQRIPTDRWFDKIKRMGWFTESFTTGLGVFVTVDATAITNNEFVSTAHGFGTNQRVVVDYEAPASVGGITARTTYFIRPGATNNDANHFSLGDASGGAAIDLTTVTGVTYPYTARVRSEDGSTGNSAGINLAKDPTSTNLYIRRFEHGIVIVNPTGAATLNTFTLPAGTWYDVDDTSYSGTITVDSTLYAVLLRDAL